MLFVWNFKFQHFPKQHFPLPLGILKIALNKVQHEIGNERLTEAVTSHTRGIDNLESRLSGGEKVIESRRRPRMHGESLTYERNYILSWF